MEKENFTKLLTVGEYADRLRVTSKHVYNLLGKEGGKNLPTKPIRIGTGPKATIRFSEKALEQWIEQQQG